MRPDDFHMAMRADLVCILKDVVGLIARIEASIPGTGECAPRPVGDGEGTAILSPDLVKPSVVRSDGGYSVDPEAQKDSVDRTGRRNEGVGRSGALAGAETSPNLGQPIPDQPTDAALPPSVETAAPPAVEFAPPPQEAPKPILIPKAAVKPKSKSKPLDPRPGRAVGVVITHKGTVVDVDVINHVVRCPKGDWRTSAPVASIMERMRNGETFGDNVLAEIGSMGEDSFRESRKRWADELAKVGVTFIHTKGVGCRIEVAT